MIDVNKAIKTVLAKGKVTIGEKETRRSVSSGKVKLVIVSSNFGEKDFGKTPVHIFKGTNLDLGTVCGKPFPVSVIGILEAGGTNILSLETTG